MKSPGLPGLKMVQARISLQRARWPATSATSATSATTGRRLYASAPAESPAPLELANIRRSLILMEDTIIFSLIERSQYALNLPVYQPGATVQQYMKDNGRQLSLLEYLLMETVRVRREMVTGRRIDDARIATNTAALVPLIPHAHAHSCTQEHVHGKIRRFSSSEENAFFPNYLPPLILPPLQSQEEEVLYPAAKEVNVNNAIMDMYLEHLLPGISETGDDGQYGSSAMYDVMILQALSKRIHYGKFVAESKFRKQTAEYTELIQREDADAIMELLTDRAVELKVIERVKLKASTFGQDLNSVGAAETDRILRLDPDAIGALYDTWVMPLTKDVEVSFVLRKSRGRSERGRAGSFAPVHVLARARFQSRSLARWLARVFKLSLMLRTSLVRSRYLLRRLD